MDTAALLDEISKPVTKKAAISFAAQSVHSIDGLLRLCLHSNYEIAFRAAWILELVACNHPEEFDEYIPQFIDSYIIQKNASCQRLFTKILMELTDKRSGRKIHAVAGLEQIIETTFEWMIDPETPVAVRVNCMDVLFNLKDKYDWIADELRAQIEFQLRNGSAALQSRGKKLLYKLSKAPNPSH